MKDLPMAPITTKPREEKTTQFDRVSRAPNISLLDMDDMVN